jgi:hypothetical protein
MIDGGRSTKSKPTSGKLVGNVILDDLPQLELFFWGGLMSDAYRPSGYGVAPPAAAKTLSGLQLLTAIMEGTLRRRQSARHGFPHCASKTETRSSQAYRNLSTAI